jgi:hypothetical protein
MFVPRGEDVASVAWSPDGTCVAALAEDGSLVVYDVAARRR